MKYMLKDIPAGCCSVAGTPSALAAYAGQDGRVDLLNKGDDEHDDSGLAVWLDLPDWAVKDATNWQGDTYTRPSLTASCEADSPAGAAAEAAGMLAGEPPDMHLPSDGVVTIVVRLGELAAWAAEESHWEDEG